MDYCFSKDINELLFGGEVNNELGEDDQRGDGGWWHGVEWGEPADALHGVVFGNVRFGQYSRIPEQRAEANLVYNIGDV